MSPDSTMPGDVDSDLLDLRTAALRDAGASGSVLDEVLAYSRNPYRTAGGSPAFPLPDEPHVAVWREYLDDARRLGTFEALRRRFAQLQFPIRSGISAEQAYADATRKGLFPQGAGTGGLILDDPDGLELAIAPTAAGRLPVLVAPARDDFVKLVQAFTERNEPAAVPATMGACIVNGLINWDRVARYKSEWLAAHAFADEVEWRSAGFPAMAADKSLYQDRLIILSRGPYSALAAERAGFTESEWLARSLVIRREHEFTHYCTWRLFGQFRTHACDELVADFVGLVRGLDRYSPDLASELLGVAENGPLAGGRLPNYKGSLSDEAFTVVSRLAARGIRTLHRVAQRMGADADDLEVLGRAIYALAQLHLEELAAEDALGRFERHFAAAGGRLARRRIRVEPQRTGHAVEDVLNAFDRLAAGDAEVIAIGRDFHLAIDEIVSNIERHARTSGQGPRLWCELVRRDDAVEMVAVDDGPAFDPLQQPQPRTDTSIDERPVGGLGIFLVRRLMSEVRYERRDGANRLRLVVRFMPAASGTDTPA